jgi:hypothetical protein
MKTHHHIPANSTFLIKMVEKLQHQMNEMELMNDTKDYDSLTTQEFVDDFKDYIELNFIEAYIDIIQSNGQFFCSDVKLVQLV